MTIERWRVPFNAFPFMSLCAKQILKNQKGAGDGAMAAGPPATECRCGDERLQKKKKKGKTLAEGIMRRGALGLCLIICDWVSRRSSRSAPAARPSAHGEHSGEGCVTAQRRNFHKWLLFPSLPSSRPLEPADDTESIIRRV